MKVFVQEFFYSDETLLTTKYYTEKADEIVIRFKNSEEKKFRNAYIKYYEGKESFTISYQHCQFIDEIGVDSVLQIYPEEAFKAFKVMVNANLHVCSNCGRKSAVCTRKYDPSGPRWVWKHKCRCGYTKESWQKTEQPECPICGRQFKDTTDQEE